MIEKLDFSEFHPLDHWPYTKRCRSFPGGGRRHLRDTWDFRRREQLLRPFQRTLWCPLGRHVEQIWYTRGGGVEVSCGYCQRPLRLPSERDLDDRPPFL